MPTGWSPWRLRGATLCDSVRLGRDINCDVQLPGENIEPAHARIEVFEDDLPRNSGINYRLQSDAPKRRFRSERKASMFLTDRRRMSRDGATGARQRELPQTLARVSRIKVSDFWLSRQSGR